MAELKIFIGSSYEKKDVAKLIQEIILDIDGSIQVLGWWRYDVFPPGDTYIMSLLKAVSKTNAGILLFADEDSASRRGAEIRVPRDNIVLEYGMFAAAHGTNNTLIARVGKPTIPTDLAGVSSIEIIECEEDIDFLEKNRGQLRNWVRQVKQNFESQGADTPETLETPETLLPQLYTAMLAVFKKAKSSHNTDSSFAVEMDRTAAELVNALAVSLETDNLGVNDALADLVKEHLREAISISAYEVTGPASWVSPAVYRYLADQIRKYMWGNIIRSKWDLKVHAWLADAINKAITNGRAAMGSESLTIFDNPKEFQWGVGTPRVQYSRVLFWTIDELRHPIAQSVIDIHESFNIPLFFVEAKPNSSDKEFAYLVLEKKDGSVAGRYGRRDRNYKTVDIEKGTIPGLGNAMQRYKALLQSKNLMFAVDAKALLNDGLTLPGTRED